ncbi:MAG: 4a-hydroxytetrahydrobiopterin dehydratase [Candidatus Levybacteria bacterium]|nr:4a-hydroxytetrahydrobiopterin dehydratase [Candidatus Levybacteria bacterium]
MDLSNKHCVPCEGGDPPLTDSEEDSLLNKISNWNLLRDGEHKLRKQFKFRDFKEAMRFVNEVAEAAEAEGHHPDIYIFYNKVQIDLFTHAVGGLSENDFIMASKIDKLKV